MKHKILYPLIIIILSINLSCGQNNNSEDNNVEVILNDTTKFTVKITEEELNELSGRANYFDSTVISLTEQQIIRKKQSEEFCKLNNIKIAEYLPTIENEEEVNLRNKNEIVNRALALAF